MNVLFKNLLILVFAAVFVAGVTPVSAQETVPTSTTVVEEEPSDGVSSHTGLPELTLPELTIDSFELEVDVSSRFSELLDSYAPVGVVREDMLASDVGAEVSSVPLSALSARYESLSANLVAFHAERSGVSLPEFMERNAADVSLVLGDMSLPSVSLSQFDSVDEVTAFLRESNSLVSSSVGLSEVAERIGAAPYTPSAQILSDASSLLGRLVDFQLRSASLPDVPVVDSSSLDGLGSDGLLFGLLADKSVSVMVRDFPDLFSRIGSEGLLSGDANAAWEASKARAAAAVSQDLGSRFSNPCQFALLESMSTGGSSLSGQLREDCQACIVGGTFLNDQLDRLVDPWSSSYIPDPDDGRVTDREWEGFADWVQESVDVQAGDSLSDELFEDVNYWGEQSAAAYECDEASTVAASSVEDRVSRVMSNLFLG